MRLTWRPVPPGCGVDSGAGRRQEGYDAGGALRPLHARVPAARATITGDMILAALARRTGIPEALFSDTIALSADDIRQHLTRHVMGQEEAVAAVVEQVLMVKAEMMNPGRPWGTFLFCGPTGTGKTALAKALAHYLFGGEDAVVRLDMSDYHYPAAAYSMATHLRQRMGRRAAAVVLLDEIEKAAPEALDLFLQGLGDGYLTTPGGERVDLRTSVVILTSNLGSDVRELASRVGRSIGYTAHEPVVDRHALLVRSVEAAVRAHLRPELVNRLDRIVTFRELDRMTMRAITRRDLATALSAVGLMRRGLTVECDERVLELLVDVGFDPAFGARPLQRAIRDRVVAPLAAWIAAHPNCAKERLHVVVEDGRVVLHARPTPVHRGPPFV